MPSYLYIFFATFAFAGMNPEAAKILTLFTNPYRSHFVAFQPLLEELAQRGHDVTVVTPFSTNKIIKNYKEILLGHTKGEDPEAMNIFEIHNDPLLKLMLKFRSLFVDSCRKVIEHPVMKNLIRSTDLEFDLVIYETFSTQCTNGFLHKFKAPSIQVIPNTLFGWIPDSVGNPNTLSYVPSVISDDENMNFHSRLSNLVFDLFVKVFFHFIIVPEMDAMMRENFPDPTLPTIYELERNSSFLFLHSHPVLHHPRPLTPNTIEVGGLHIKSNQELPKDLKKFLDDAPDGVIYFSLGSYARSVDMPDEMRNAILKSFSKLKQKVLWKWEVDTLPGQPQNLRIGKWLPQNGILAHPNVKLFITHGGLLSLQEAIYFGVPLISIPLASDQNFNADVTKNRGIGVILNVHNITEESLDWALNEVLQQPRYRESAQRLSNIFKDMPQTSLDRAVFWVEYVIRHQGAKHLRSGALDLNFFQYYLLDVIAVLSIGLCLSVFLVIYTVKIIIKCLFSKKGRTMRNENTNKKKN